MKLHEALSFNRKIRRKIVGSHDTGESHPFQSPKDMQFSVDDILKWDFEVEPSPAKLLTREEVFKVVTATIKDITGISSIDGWVSLRTFRIVDELFPEQAGEKLDV